MHGRMASVIYRRFLSIQVPCGRSVYFIVNLIYGGRCALLRLFLACQTGEVCSCPQLKLHTIVGLSGFRLLETLHRLVVFGIIRHLGDFVLPVGPSEANDGLVGRVFVLDFVRIRSRKIHIVHTNITCLRYVEIVLK